MNQREDSTQIDLVGFPPGLAAPIRPAVPRHAVHAPASLPCREAGPLTSSPVIDVDDDLDELELEDDDLELAGDELDGAGPGSVRARAHEDAAQEAWAGGPLVPGSATLGDRARRFGARFASKVVVPVAAIAILVIAMGGTWSTAGATPAPPLSAALQPAHAAATTPHAAGDEPEHATRSKSAHHELTGKLNLNTASEDQLMVLPSVGPAKAERIVTWRKKNGGFKRTADLRRVKGFGYKTFKKLEPYLDIKGDTTLAPK